MSFEKVNPSHPDKIADRIAGAIVDLAYTKQENPKIAVEVLIGHKECHIIAETSIHINPESVCDAVERITGQESALNWTTYGKDDEKCLWVDFVQVAQDPELAKNQAEEIRCGDNGIFKGCYPSHEESLLSGIVGRLYAEFPTDGKYILNEEEKLLIACQSNIGDKGEYERIRKIAENLGLKAIINPLGPWTGGTDVDTGATNRKLGSDMGRAVTGGGLHGKDLSKADVSVNIACHLLAKKFRTTVEAFCAIGDKEVQFVMHRTGRETVKKSMPYKEVVEMAKGYIDGIGGFEKLAEWGLI